MGSGNRRRRLVSEAAHARVFLDASELSDYESDRPLGWAACDKSGQLHRRCSFCFYFISSLFEMAERMDSVSISYHQWHGGIILWTH